MSRRLSCSCWSVLSSAWRRLLRFGSIGGTDDAEQSLSERDRDPATYTEVQMDLKSEDGALIHTFEHRAHHNGGAPERERAHE